MKEPTTRALVMLAAPAAASAVLNNAFRAIDQYAVQWLGTEASAAVGSLTYVLIVCYALMCWVSAGVGPLLARAEGAGDLELGRQVVGRGVTGAVVLGAVVSGCCLLLPEWCAWALGVEGRTADLVVDYLRWLSPAAIPMALALVVDAAFIAMGRTGLAMGLQLGAAVLNGLLNPLFIYGLDLGIGGAALATGVSRVLTMAVGLWLLWRQLGLRRADLGAGPLMRRVGRIGAPIAIHTAFYAGVYWMLLKVAISPLGPATNAALGIGYSALEGFAWPTYLGLSQAVASLVGRHLGEGRPDRAEKAVRLGMPVALGLGTTVMTIFLVGGRPLASLFTSDPVVLEEAVRYAHILALSQVFVAFECLSEGVLQGAGHTRPVLWWSAPLNALRVPLGWAMAFPLGWGAAGVWWAINLTTVAKCLGKGQAAWRGEWKIVDV